MADLVQGTNGYVNNNFSTFRVARTGDLRWPAAAIARLPFRQTFRIAHGFEKSLRRGRTDPNRSPWEREVGLRAGIWVLAMAHEEQGFEASADVEKDESMLFRRTVFEQEDWTRHRSSDRHSRHILSIASSRVIWSLGPPVLKLTFIAALVAIFNEAVLLHLFPFWVPLLHVDSLPFQLTAPALALLLVFRTNASYGRFDEARKAWESNVNRSRDLARQALTWIRLPADLEKLDRLLGYCVSTAPVLK